MKNINFTTIVIHIVFSFIAAFTAIGRSRQAEKKEDKKLYIALMIGGFIWSQLQTEYLIWRVDRKTKKSLKHELSDN